MHLGAPIIESGILNNLQGPVLHIRRPIEKVVQAHVYASDTECLSSPLPPSQIL